MMNFLKGLIKRSSKVEPMDWTAIQSLINENNFINKSIRANFYENLSKKFVCDLTPDNPSYNIFFNEFRSSNHILIECFDNLLDSGLSEETLDIFYKKYKEIISSKYKLPGTHVILALYWYHIFNKLNSEVQETNRSEMKLRFGIYFKNIKESATQILQI